MGKCSPCPESCGTDKPEECPIIKKIVNQCDGCLQGNIPDKEGFHRDENGYPFMMCCKDDYKEK